MIREEVEEGSGGDGEGREWAGREERKSGWRKLGGVM